MYLYVCCSVYFHVLRYCDNCSNNFVLHLEFLVSNLYVCCSVHYSALQWFDNCRMVCMIAWCSVVQCVAVCCSVLQCVAVCCSVL